MTTPGSAGHTLVYGSSLRAHPIEVTLKKATSWMARCGITRVTNTTRLDRIGIPVYASIRPQALPHSLCVNAGKGLTNMEAQVGAFMEAIEFAMAEASASDLEIFYVPPHEVLDGTTRPGAILDFCPLLDVTIPHDTLLPCMVAEEILSGQHYLIPAELICVPAPEQLIPKRYFGPNSNGLCSGNTLQEATVHGLAECIERDINTFRVVHDNSQSLEIASLPPHILQLTEAILAAGLEIFVRYQANSYDIPWIRATIYDPCDPTPLFINSGYGCHPHASIAVVRAICEAAQSRLSLIHGGRDDLTHAHGKFANRSIHDIARLTDISIGQLSDSNNSISFAELPDHSDTTQTLQDAYNFLVEALAKNGLHRICRVVHTSPDDDLQVARIVVPGLEYFLESAPRAGRRLKDFVENGYRPAIYHY